MTDGTENHRGYRAGSLYHRRLHLLAGQEEK